jgi:hypothetical protein
MGSGELVSLQNYRKQKSKILIENENNGQHRNHFFDEPL